MTFRTWRRHTRTGKLHAVFSLGGRERQDGSIEVVEVVTLCRRNAPGQPVEQFENGEQMLGAEQLPDMCRTCWRLN